jgi:hypothetical protein
MSTEITTDNNSTGPRTEEGKSIAAQNARKTGLFTTRDFIRSEERNEYEQLRESLESELNPEGPLENQIASEIRTAIWRLRRCAQLEADLAAGNDDAQDPMDPTSPEAKQQLSVDRARNQATRLLHKNTAELRRLQTERQFRNEIAADGIDTEGLSLLCDFHTAISHADRAAKSKQRHQLDQLKTEIDTMELEGRHNAHQLAQAASESEFTKRTPPTEPRNQEIARNSPCPCNSGEKYKRCCGKLAPPLLGVTKEMKEAA